MNLPSFPNVDLHASGVVEGMPRASRCCRGTPKRRDPTRTGALCDRAERGDVVAGGGSGQRALDRLFLPLAKGG
jgi:hypothetical protein